MDNTATSTPPVQVYAERAARFGAERNALTAQWNRIANLRLLAFVLAAVGIVWGLIVGNILLWASGLALLVAFFVLVWRHNVVGRRRRRADELFRINDEALLRAARDWDSLPMRHHARPPSDEPDPYARDLDIFGRASLFHLLETTGTYMGEATLARWLLSPAPPPVIRARQEAVRELAPMIDLRDELYLRGRLMGEEKPDPAPFLEWAEQGPWLNSVPWLRVVSWVSPLLFWALAVAHATGFTSYPFWFLVGAANIVLTLGPGKRVNATIEKASAGEQGFKHYASAFELLSTTQFRSAEMQRLQARLTTGDTPAHVALRRLHRIMSWAIPEGSQLYLLIQAVTLWEIHHLAVLEGWQRDTGPRARDWLDTLGEVEALSALAALSHSEPAWAFPSVDDAAPCLEAEMLGHPLLPDGVRVDNDVTVGPAGTFLLVTGSNMSGKSTLLRATGVNVVLAQAGGPVCAARLRMPPVSLWTSMRVEDSLERGVSYFMAELQRLKQVVDAAKVEQPGKRLLYLLDEILQGTNTEERQIAARRVIMYLVSRGALGAVSTHDLTLAEAPDVRAAARMVHFTETIRDADGAGPQMTFDYKLRDGLATSRNALKLMEIVGLDLGD